jgi:hypothetical protein
MKRFFLLFGLLIPTRGFAQNYSIDWYKIARGGGTSTGVSASAGAGVGLARKSGASKDRAIEHYWMGGERVRVR